MVVQLRNFILPSLMVFLVSSLRLIKSLKAVQLFTFQTEKKTRKKNKAQSVYT